MKQKILKENNMNEKGRGWQPKTKLQDVLLETYKTKSTISNKLQISQPTLMRLLADEKCITFKQIKTISTDAKISIIKLISLL
jgi:hypothetical protein